MTYKNFFIVLFAIFILAFSIFSEIKAETNSYNITWGRLNCNGCSTSGIRSTQVTDPWNFQAYAADFGGNYDGHGDFGPAGGKYGVDGCLNSDGSMWSGSCWNIVDANSNGNVGGNSGSVPSPYRDIGNTSNNFTYAVGSYYVNDAEIYPSIRVYGRQVSINGFNTTNSTVSVGGQFDITWDTGERTSGSDVELTFSGPVNCGGGSPLYFSGNPGGVTCTGTSAGTATFTLRATGYGGGGTKTVTSNPINVNIIQPPVSCGNNTVEAGEQCDTGVNNGSCPRSCSSACTTNSCSVNLCGNGVVNAGEQCDNGVNNGASPRACSNYCTNNSAPGNVNISLTVNGPGTVGSNLVAGRFGPGTYSGVIPTNTFVQFDVAMNPGEASSWTWGGPCSFFNSPLSGICAGNATVDTANVVTFIPIPVSGTLTPANSSCTIPAGQSGCYSPTLTWTTSGFRNGVVSTVTSSTGVPGSVTGNSGSSSFYVPHNSADPANEFYLNNGGVLATAVVNTSCAAGTVWSGGVCTVVTSPTVDYVQINSTSVAPDGSTQYTVTIKGTDTGGASKIRYQYALINVGGTNIASRRGWLAWNLLDPWTTHKDYRGCGNGYAAVLSSSVGGYDVYGHQYVNLVGCTSTVSGNERTTVFTVTFPTTFTAPLTLNDIGGAIYNSDGNWNSNSDAGLYPWKNYDINFGLYMPPPTNLSVTCPAPGTTLTTTWTSPGAGYNTFYYRAGTPSTDWTGNVEQSTVTGTSKSRASVSGQSYNVWVHTRHASDPLFYSSLVSDTVTCGAPSAPVVTLTASPNPVASGNSTTLTWTVSGATSCSSVGANAIPAGNWSTAGSGNVSSGAIASARTYQLSCTGAGGTTLSAPVTVNVTSAPVVTLTASPNPVASGNSTTLTWTVSGATSCSSVGANAIPAGNWSTAGSGNVSSGAIASARTYQLSCTGAGGTTLSPSVTVNISATPSLTVTSPTTVAPGASVNLSFNNVNIPPSPTPQDWIGLYSTSAAYPSSELAYIYTSNCSQPASGPARTSGTCTGVFSMPATPGTYHFRLYSQDLYDQLQAVSNTVTVSAPSPFTLSVVANSSLGGRVSGPGIDCGADCSENVSSGSNVTLTAIPSSSYWRFNGWTGACSGNNTVCTINNITAPVSATALFVPRAFIYKEF